MPGPAQDATPESLLRNAVAKIRTFDSYTVEFIRYDEFDQTRSVHHRRLSFARPFRFRIEDLEPAAETVRMADGKLISQPACGRFVDVFSATLRWSFNKDLKQYSKLTFDPSKEDPAVQFAPRIRGQLDDVSLRPDETLSLGGGSMTTVIRAAIRPAYWSRGSTNRAVRHQIHCRCCSATTKNHHEWNSSQWSPRRIAGRSLYL